MIGIRRLRCRYRPFSGHEMKPFEIVFAFAERPSAHDGDGMCTLREEEHVVIDGLGVSATGRDALRQAWQSCSPASVGGEPQRQRSLS